MAKKIIMSWSKCKIEVGKTGDDEAMAATLTDVGTINDKSTTLATEDGETLTATATGGIVVAEEEGEPVVTLTTRVKEMDFEPMTEEEALIQIDLLGHDFFVYTDRDSNEVNVMYRRTGGGYGLLKPKAE